MTEKTSIVIADDHPTFRLGLSTAIARDPRFEILAEADNGVSALRLVEEIEPQIAVVDWDMPELNGLDLARSVARGKSKTKVIILTMHDEESLFNEAIDSGVSGFVLKDNAVNDIIESLCAVRRGDVYLSPSVSSYLLRRNRRGTELRKQNPGLEDLTNRERSILGQIAANQTTKEIASALGVSPRTIETHRRNICQKLGLSGSHRLLQFALKHKSEL